MSEDVTSGVSSLTDDFTAILSAADAGERWTILTRAFRRLDLAHVTYGFADPETVRRTSLYSDLTLSTGDAAAVRRCFCRDHHPDNPLMTYLRGGQMAPLLFDLDAMTGVIDDPADMRACGFTRGVLIPLPSVSACPVAGLFVGLDLPSAELREVWRVHGARLVTLAHMFHVWVAGEMMRRRDGAAPLSPREKSCLQSISRGDRVAAIAHELGLAEATVELHLRNARRKLRARSLPEAVARALLYRQIEST